MTGPRPKSPQKSPRRSRGRRASQSLMPWSWLSLLGLISLLMGLLLSVPLPPLWAWIPMALGLPLLILGSHRPERVPGKTDRGGLLLAYVGGLLLVVALAVAANFIGSEQSFENIRFIAALVGLVLLTAMSIALTLAVAMVSAQTGARLLRGMDYRRSLAVLMGTCLLGTGVGALVGFLTLVLPASR